MAACVFSCSFNLPEVKERVVSESSFFCFFFQALHVQKPPQLGFLSSLLHCLLLLEFPLPSQCHLLPICPPVLGAGLFSGLLAGPLLFLHYLLQVAVLCGSWPGFLLFLFFHLLPPVLHHLLLRLAGRFYHPLLFLAFFQASCRSRSLFRCHYGFLLKLQIAADFEALFLYTKQSRGYVLCLLFSFFLQIICSKRKKICKKTKNMFFLNMFVTRFFFTPFLQMIFSKE